MRELLHKQYKTCSNQCNHLTKRFQIEPTSKSVHGANSEPYSNGAALPGHDFSQIPVTSADNNDTSPLQVGLPSCGCTPCPTYSCQSIRPGNKDIINAFNLAQNWLSGASNNLALHQTSKLPLVTNALQKHFGLSSNVTAIKLNIDKLNNSPVTTSPINGNCRPVCPAGTAGSDIYATSPIAWSNTNCYEFCDPFFSKASNDLRASIALHEMAHSWLSCNDHAYENDSNYPPTAAMNNADSYACLVRDIK